MLKRLFKRKVLNYNEAKKLFQSRVDNGSSSSSIEKELTKICKKNIDNSLKYKKAFFSVMKDVDRPLAVKYGEEVIIEDLDKMFVRALATRYKWLGNQTRYIELMNQFSRLSGKEYINLNSLEYSLSNYTMTLKELSVSDNYNLEYYINKSLKMHKSKRLFLLQKAFSELKDSNTEIALKYGDMVVELEQEPKFIRVLLSRAKRLNDSEKIYKYSKIIFDLTGDDEFIGEIIKYENQSILNNLREYLQTNEAELFNSELKNLLNMYPDNKDQIYYLVAILYYSFNKQKSIDYLHKGLEFKESYTLYLKLFEFYIQQGNLNKAVDSMPLKVENKTLERKINIWKGNIELLNNGFDFGNISREPIIESENKVLYLLHNTLPFHSGGYATRAHGLMTGVNSIGSFEMQGVSRLGYPKDILKLVSDDHIQYSEQIDDILYHRLKSDTRRGNVTYYEYIKEYAEAVVEMAKKEKPLVIHAASNLYNGLAAVYAAKKLGIKSIYEIRGLWEITRISREPEWKGSDMYRFNAEMETTAALNADRVITITEALKQEMISRGVPETKISVLPNGVVSDRFKPLVRDKILAETLNLEDKTVIGFIGSFAQYEGLEYLVEAVQLLIHRGIKNLGVLMVGDGAVWEEIQEQVKDKGLSEYFVFTGRVAHEEVEKYYSLVDIAPFPRKGLPVCEMVSPLKPFEAMAMEKAVVSSNVDALAEIVQDGYNGLLFEKDNVEDFANKLEKLIESDELREKLGKQSREWVIKERDWKVLSERLVSIYEEL